MVRGRRAAVRRRGRRPPPDLAGHPEIGEAQARGIVRRLPAGTEAVLATHLLDPERVAEPAAAVGVRTVQVRRHGRRRLPPPGARLLKAVHVTGGEALGRALDYAADADALVLDSRTADRLGGTGRIHDWSVSARVVAAVAPVPVHLAGGAPARECRGGGRARAAHGFP